MSSYVRKILVVLGACGGMCSVASSAPAGKPAATVNGEMITLEEVDELLSQRGSALLAPTPAQIRQDRLATINGLIDERLIRRFLAEHGPKINEGDIEKQWAALEAALKQQKQSMADYLRENHMTEAQAKGNMRMLLQLDGYVKARSTEAQLRKYYELNKDYFDKVTVRTSHIVIRVSPGDKPGRDAARQLLQKLRAEIAAGKITFEAAAKDYSQCPSAPKGGDLGYILRKFQNVDEAYARAAFAMKVGDLSEVVETEFGVDLIKVTDRKPGRNSKYEEVADDVRDSYAEDVRQSLLSDLRSKANIRILLP